MVKSKYDWVEIQVYYNEGHTYQEVKERFGCAFATIAKAKKRGDLVTRTCGEALSLRNKTKGAPKHSEKTKLKISIIRKNYIKEHPEKAPYLLNHYSKGASFPEQYFKEVFEKEDIKLEQYVPYHIYELDFANSQKKIDIEIDGEQHFCDTRIVESDLRRNHFLEKNGWIIFRIRWREYQKKTFEEKKKIIQEIKILLEKTN